MAFPAGGSNNEFVTNKTLPLLEGLLDWWACYLVKRPCSPAGSHGCPADGWRYDDANDAVRTTTAYSVHYYYYY
eukprot:COSAG06_NODE_17051_length_964_cov_1.736416_2_plen_74_part_00